MATLRQIDTVFVHFGGASNRFKLGEKEKNVWKKSTTAAKQANLITFQRRQKHVNEAQTSLNHVMGEKIHQQ